MLDKKRAIFLAAGGTGGHIFPALALAASLKAEGYDKVYLLSDDRFKNYSTDRENIYFIPSSYKTGLKDMARNALGLWKVLSLMLIHRPQHVIGFGGYPSFVPLLWAHIFNIPIILQEQNAILGKVNHLFASKAKVILLGSQLINEPIYSSSSFIKKLLAKKIGIFKNASEVIIKPPFKFVGNPVRQEFLQKRQMAYANKEASFNHLTGNKTIVDDRITILITGGSQGANIFNDVVIKALELLPIEIRRRLFVYHQSNEPVLQKYYDALEIKNEVRDFFANMAVVMAEADLVIGRAGASTIAEIICLGKASILVPYPLAAENHQYYNAKILSDNKAAIMVVQENFTTEYLFKLLEGLLVDKATLNLMADCAYKLFYPCDAAIMKILQA